MRRSPMKTDGKTWLLGAAAVLFAVTAVGRLAAEPKTASAAERVELPSPALEHAFAENRPGKVGDGRYYTPFYGYVISPHAVVAEGKVFCAFQNAVGQPIVMAYDVAEKRWAGPVKASEQGLGGRDAHGNPSLCIDSKGYLHVFYGCHGGAMRHTRSARPYDIAAWQEQEPPTPRATYPQTMRMADGTICLLYRAGGHMEPWSLRTSEDDGRSWSPAEKVIEMRLDPPDRLAAAYCQFFPGSGDETIHCFWNHKDDNAARVSETQPHPWRPLKYPGLHEAVYRYNVYYICRDAQGAWRNAAGEEVKLPVSKAEADDKCLVYDSGDEFAFLGSRQAADGEDRPCFRFGTGVVDWAHVSKRVVVPPRDKFARFESGGWRISDQMPESWPPEVVRVMAAEGEAAYGDEEARGWFIFCRQTPWRPDGGGTVFLYHDQAGYATREGGPARTN